MVQSLAPTVPTYLKSLPKERRDVISAVRNVIVKNLPKGYKETVNWGMIAYEVPLKQYPNTYNKQPLCYLALAAQKNYFALHMLCAYIDKTFLTKLQNGFKAAGKKLDMGKGCIRFKKLEDLPLDVIGERIAAVPMKEFIAIYEKNRGKK